MPLLLFVPPLITTSQTDENTDTQRLIPPPAQTEKLCTRPDCDEANIQAGEVGIHYDIVRCIMLYYNTLPAVALVSRYVMPCDGVLCHLVSHRVASHRLAFVMICHR